MQTQIPIRLEFYGYMTFTLFFAYFAKQNHISCFFFLSTPTDIWSKIKCHSVIIIIRCEIAKGSLSKAGTILCSRSCLSKESESGYRQTKNKIVLSHSDDAVVLYEIGINNGFRCFFSILQENYFHTAF